MGGGADIGKFEDLTNRHFNRLKVIEKDISRSNGRVYWICECKCGKRISVTTSDLKSGHTQSCGCYQKYKVSIVNKRFNTFIEENDYYKCEVSDGSYFLIDKEDKDKIDRYCWRKDGNGYVMTTIHGKNVYLHKIILNLPKNMLIDHRNHIVHDYRKSNLRIVSQSKNQMNAKLRVNNTSGATGVYWSKQRMKWIAQLKINGTNMYLGGFDKYESACQARERAEEKYFGKYSYRNSLKVEE